MTSRPVIRAGALMERGIGMVAIIVGTNFGFEA
jgi:hypothetical protein